MGNNQSDSGDHTKPNPGTDKPAVKPEEQKVETPRMGNILDWSEQKDESKFRKAVDSTSEVDLTSETGRPSVPTAPRPEVKQKGDVRGPSEQVSSTKGSLSSPVEAIQPTSQKLSRDVSSTPSRITPDVGPAKVATGTAGDSLGAVNKQAGAQVAPAVEPTSVKHNAGETKLGDAKSGTDLIGGSRTFMPQNLDSQVPQNKNAVSNPGEHLQTARAVSSVPKIDAPGVTQPVAQPTGEMSPTAVQRPRMAVDSPSGNLANAGVKQEAKPVVGDNQPTVAGSQFKSEQARADQTKAEPVIPQKGDGFSTAAYSIQTNRQDIAAKGIEPKFETGRPAEQAGAKDPAPFKDPKSAGVLNEAFGQRTEAGPRVEPSSQLAGNKQDAISSGQKADQITKGIEGRINEGAKQPGATDGASTGGRQPGIDGGGKSQGITDGAQPGIKQSGGADGAAATVKQPNVSEGSGPSVRQPLNEAGDKGSSGGGGSGSGSVTAESTRKIDAGMGAGGKAEGQTASGGMGGGSSAPVDRAPHKPFSVEDAQPTKGGEGAGGKGGDVVGGKAGDIAGAKGGAATGAGPGTGTRFDTGEVRGTEPGARFDSGELKDGRSPGAQAGGKSGEGAGIKGTDSGIVKSTDVSGTKGATGGGQGIGGSSGGSGSGSSGSSEAGILGDKRQPSLMPDGVLNQGGKTGKVGDGVSGGGGILGTDVPIVLPGAFSGKGGGRQQSDQILTDKGKAEAAPVGKQDAVSAAGKYDSEGPAGRSDQVAPGGKEPAVQGGKGEPVALGGRGEAGGVAGKGEQPRDFKDKGQKADVGIPAAMAGPIGAGAAEVGGVLKNFAQSVLSDGKTSGQAGDGTPISKDAKDATKSPAAIDGSGKEVPPVRQDFAGPGKKTQILPTDQTPGVKVVGPGGSPLDASAKKIEPLAPGSAAFPGGADGIAAGGSDDGGDLIPVEEFNLPEIDLASEAGEVEEVNEIEESAEARTEDEMHYELALGLQLYTSIAEAQYGAYHYYTKEGDTVESVSREIVGDVRCSPLVFSLNKDHIVASTEYGVHPFKVGVMVQLPTPRDLKEFFGNQT